MLSSNFYSYHGLALVFEYNRQQGLHQETVGLAEQYLQYFPNELLIYEYLAFAYLQLGRYDLAEKTVQQGLSYFSKAPLLVRFKLFIDRMKIAASLRSSQ
jgi:tetratricopeptide (TPR) repeat protein